MKQTIQRLSFLAIFEDQGPKNLGKKDFIEIRKLINSEFGRVVKSLKIESFKDAHIEYDSIFIDFYAEAANIFDYENDGKVKKCEVELQYEIFKNNLKISFIDNETGEIRQREIRGFM